MDCTSPATISDWISCNVDAVVTPVTDAVIAIVGVSITIALLFAGLAVTRRVIRQVGR